MLRGNPTFHEIKREKHGRFLRFLKVNFDKMTIPKISPFFSIRHM